MIRFVQRNLLSLQIAIAEHPRVRAAICALFGISAAGCVFIPELTKATAVTLCIVFTITLTFLANIVANLFSSWLEKKCSWRDRSVTAFWKNNDLLDKFAKAVEMAIRHETTLANHTQLTPDARLWIHANFKSLLPSIHAAVNVNDPSDPKSLFHGLHKYQFWRVLIPHTHRLVGLRLEGYRVLINTWAWNGLSQPQILYLASVLERDVSKAFHEALKDDFVNEGYAWAALDLAFQRKVIDGFDTIETSLQSLYGVALEIHDEVRTGNKIGSEVLTTVGKTNSLVEDIHAAVVRPAAPVSAEKSNFGDANILPNPTFQGRVAQLDFLHKHFTSPTNALGRPLSRGHLVIVAEGGMGKSQLAQRYAELHESEWDGIWWIDASPELHEASVRALVTFLKLPVAPQASLPELRAAIRKFLDGNKRHLIILDSFACPAPNAPSYDLLQELDPGPPACLLITTRDQNLPDHFGPHLELPELDPADAISLLRRDTPRLQPKGQKDHDDKLTADLAAICSHLGHHALAVALTGDFLKTDKGLTPAELLQTLQASDQATLALFERSGLKGKAHQYAVSVGQSLSLHLPRFQDPASIEILKYLSITAPDNIDLLVLAASSRVPIAEVRELLVRLSSASIVQYREGGEHGVAKIHVLMQMVLRTVLFAPKPGAAETPQKHPEPPITRYLNVLIEEFADVEKHERYPRRSRLLPHAEALLARADAGQGGPEVPRAAALLRAEVALHRHIIGDFPGAEEDIARSIDWGERQSPRNERSLAIRYASRASIRKHRGDLPGAEEDIARSIAWGESQSRHDERALAILYSSRASIRRDRGDLAGAEEDIARSIEWGERQSPRDERSLAIDYASRARIRQDRGDLPGAEEDIARSIKWGERQSPRDERGLAIDYATRASIRLDRGDLPGAEEDIARSIEWEERQSPRNERDLAICYASRAGIRQHRGDLPGAEEDIARCIEWGERQNPRDERGLAIRYTSRASIRQDRGDLPGAEEDIARSIEWGERQSPRDERSLAIRHTARASIRQHRGDLSGAEEDIARSIEWGERQSPRNERDLAIDYASRARIRQDRGDLPGAEEDIARSIEWGERQTPRNERSLAIDYASRASIYRDQKRFAEARRDIDAALAWFEANIPGDTRRIGKFRAIRDSIPPA